MTRWGLSTSPREAIVPPSPPPPQTRASERAGSGPAPRPLRVPARTRPPCALASDGETPPRLLCRHRRPAATPAAAAVPASAAAAAAAAATAVKRHCPLEGRCELSSPGGAAPL